MTSAYVLIAAMLVLGGVLAAVGDRVGTKAGKARLRLFGLRPKQTATLITIFTGTLISASTFGILFATSESLRQGVFRLDEILARLRNAERDLTRVTLEKQQVSQQLQQAKVARDRVQKRLAEIDRDFQQAQARLERASEQVRQLQSEIEALSAERESLSAERDRLQEQISDRDAELARREQELAEREELLQATQTQLQTAENRLEANQERLQQSRERLAELETQRDVLQQEIATRDTTISDLDRQIERRDRALQYREIRLRELETEIGLLQQEVATLEQNFQYYQTYYNALREGNLALVRGQVLAFGVVRNLDNPELTEKIVDEILRKANQNALDAMQLGSPASREVVIQITRRQVEQLRQEIDDGEDYVVQILAAGNYLRGEKQVRVFADVVPNREVFEAGEVVATVAIESSERVASEHLQERLDLLLASSQFRARRAGILGRIQVGDDSLSAIRFIEELERNDRPFEKIQAIAAETTYTSGPLKLRLVALFNGEIVSIS